MKVKHLFYGTYNKDKWELIEELERRNVGSVLLPCLYIAQVFRSLKSQEYFMFDICVDVTGDHRDIYNEYLDFEIGDIEKRGKRVEPHIEKVRKWKCA